MCFQCHAPSGAFHEDGCELEICPSTGKYLRDCGCSECGVAPPHGETERQFRQFDLAQAGRRIPVGSELTVPLPGLA